MKEIKLKIKDNKYQFFLELISNLDFVELETEDSKEEVLENLKTGLKELKQYQQGSLKTSVAEDFLNEL
ncbi:hypothetical protein [Owenweeksia hongkongensis]|uniref:Uncharacterized protein n=1 Tax=Owenweeksia hongkongensis (strain DSM 17368 / CIP 108786 / JCM 12287 / NRRL B-23963 / UST20020801) TaxID=926562 RepID=G8R644_OWEHD|nr:hypothetical protein [Owenweeksia hongkongensis]AEV32234.1 hypothetical protein Oweho_1229 [Owenweeksia hongkongensis DSM 17368]